MRQVGWKWVGILLSEYFLSLAFSSLPGPSENMSEVYILSKVKEWFTEHSVKYWSKRSTTFTINMLQNDSQVRKEMVSEPLMGLPPEKAAPPLNLSWRHMSRIPHRSQAHTKLRLLWCPSVHSTLHCQSCLSRIMLLSVWPSEQLCKNH